MAEFKTLSEASDAFNALEKSSDTLLSEGAEQIKSLEEAATESKEAFEVESKSGAELVSKVEGLEKEKTDLESKNAELEQNKLDVQEEAARIAANAGVDPLDKKEEGDGGESLVEQYNALSGTARTKFYQDNKEAFGDLI